MASAAGIDPLDFRLMNTTDERMLSVSEGHPEAYGLGVAARRRAGTGRAAVWPAESTRKPTWPWWPR